MSLLRKFIWIGLISSLLVSCTNSEKETVAIRTTVNSTADTAAKRTLSEAFKEYWYAGTAEITSYKLSQERYGELRDGTAVNIFVTEDFLPEVQVKADRQSPKNTPVLKLNSTKKYVTGIYPYSVMTSSFSPVNTKDHALKVTHSMQEWCGQVYMQLNNRKSFNIQSHSYFEGEADQELKLPKALLESDLWSTIRINPEELPMGELSMIPSFEYFRMSHQKISAHNATANLVQGDSISAYTLSYPSLKRELKIYFSSEFPYTIERWEEKHANGLTTKAEKMKRMRSAYWGQNSNAYVSLRDSLGL